MDIEKIIALHDAGFTAEEIAKVAGAFTPAPAPEQTKEEPVKQEPKVEVTEQTAQPDNSALLDSFAALNKQFAELSQTLKAQAIHGTEQPKAQSVDDILSAVLNPNGSPIN